MTKQGYGIPPLTLLYYELVANISNRVASDVSTFFHLLPEEGWGCRTTTGGVDTGAGGAGTGSEGS